MEEIRKSMQEQGFCRVQDVFLSEELDCCEKIITSIMERNGFFLGLLKTDMSVDNDCERKQLELLRPSLLSVALRKSQIYKQCYSIAKEYFGGSAYYLFDHAIFKMPNSSTVTPWHQDQAYLGDDMIIPSLHFWIPFQNTDINNGAMQFVKGSHYELLEHKLAYQNNEHILTVVNTPENNIVNMVINRGDVSLHTNLTLHSSTANNSDLPRKAWILHFGRKPEFYKQLFKVRNFFIKRVNSFFS